MKILLTGGSGNLGTELRKYLDVDAPSHAEFDITNPDIITDGYDLIVHCAAYTDVSMAQWQKDLCYATNVLGTRNLVNNAPIVYISTEYVYSGERGNYKETDYPEPVNFYGLTKLLGEYECAPVDHVIIRTLFKPRPFKYEYAFRDQITSGDYVDVIAPKIAYVVKNFDKFPSIINIGTGKKTIIELARQTREVKPISYKDTPVVLPRDTSLDLSLWRDICED